MTLEERIESLEKMVNYLHCEREAMRISLQDAAAQAASMNNAMCIQTQRNGDLSASYALKVDAADNKLLGFS